MPIKNKTAYSFEAVLIQQSPMLHFQSEQQGACLRASEVKPKLDKFIIKNAEKEMGKGIIPQNWFRVNENGKQALDYKLTISSYGYQKVLESIPRIFYGNTGDSKEKVGCIKGDNIIQVICFIPELLDYLMEKMDDFFLVTNFGRMSDKGFGSYTLRESNEYSDTEIGKKLAESTEAPICYVVRGNKNYSAYPPENKENKFKQDNIFDDIKKFYSVMKSGLNFSKIDKNGANSELLYHRSYLFLYCHEKNEMGNEKYAQKVKGLLPAGKGNTPSLKKKIEECKYVRGILGLEVIIDEERLEKKKKSKDSNNKKRLFVLSEKKSGIERMQSPIFFKIIGNRFFVVANRIPKDIFDKEFRFIKVDENEKLEKELKINTPKEFDIDDFMNYFCNHYNEDVAKIIKRAKNYDGNGRINIKWAMSNNRKIETAYQKSGGEK